MIRRAPAPLLSCCLVASFTGALQADPTATLLPSGGGAGVAFDTIQEAVDAAAAGDTIELSMDTFSGPGNRNVVIDKDLTIRGEGGRQTTVIDCEGLGRAFHVTGSAVSTSTLFTQFTIENGAVSGLGALGQGGGMLVDNGASPRLEFVSFQNCTAEGQGGGFAQRSGVLDVSRCLFVGNQAASAGGLFSTLIDGVIGDSIFRNNSADVVGGALAVSGTGASGMSFNDCEILDNTAGLQGGGIYFELVVVATVERCRIVGNHSDSSAGGVSMVGDPFLPGFDVVLIKNSILASNTANFNGGGMRLADVGGVFQNVTLVDNTAGGSGGGVDAISSDGYLFTNSIVWGNRSSDANLLTQQVVQAASGLPLVDYCNVEGLTPFLNNISEDPVFRDAPGLDYRIRPTSPCRDTGDPVFDPLLGPSDIEGQMRVFNGRIDIGADEYAFDEVLLITKPLAY